MSVVLWCGLLAAATPELDAAERLDAAMVVLTPFGAATRTGSSRLLGAAASAFERETDLRLLPGAQVGIDTDAMLACPAERRLSCWVALAREARIALLFIVTLAPSAGADRAAMSMLDPSEARGLSEEQIFDRIVEVPPRAVADAEAFFEEALSAELRPYLEARHHFRPFGDLLLQSRCEDCAVLLGERSLGVSSGPVLIRRVRPGLHTLSLTRAGRPMCRTELNVLAGRTNDAACMIDAGPGREVLLYGGIAGAALGAASVIGSLVLLGGTTQTCVGRDPGGCQYLHTARSGFDASGAPLTAGEANRGFPLMPAGAGLLVLGATWSAGSALSDEVPWWLVAASGVALGGAATALALAAE